MASILSWAKKTAQTVEHTAAGMAQGVSHVPGILAHDVQAGRGAIQQGVGNVIRNQQYAQEGRQQVQQNMPAVRSTRDFVQQNFTRPAVQTAATLAPSFSRQPLKPVTFHPGNRIEKGLLGETPVQNIQAGVQSNYREHPNLPKPARLGLAGAYGAGQAAMDAPVAIGAKNVAVKAVTSDVAKAGGRTARDVALMKPHRNISDQQLAVAGKVRSTMQGGPISPMDLTEQEVKTYRKVQQKLGAKVNDHGAVDDALAKRLTWETNMQQKKAALQDANTRLNNYVQVGGSTKKVTGIAEDAPNSSRPTLPQLEQTPSTPKLRAGTSLGNGTPPQRGFAETIKNSDKTAPQLKQDLSARDTTYNIKTNKRLISQVRHDIGTNYDKAYERATTDVSDRGLATAGELIKLHADRGEFTQAIAIADQAVRNGTEAGRAVQAMSLYNRLSPSGIIRYATKQAQNAKRTLSPEIAKSLTDMAKEVEKMPDGEAKAFATHKMMELARSQNVSPVAKQLIDVWKAGLLTAPPTHIGNLVGNTIEGATQSGLVNPLATAFDVGTSLVTGKRSRSLTLRGNVTGVKEGLNRGGQYLKTGYDSRNPIGKYDLENKTYFGQGALGKAAHAYTESVFRILGGADQPFYYRTLRNSLQDRAITAFKNSGLPHSEKQGFIDNFIKEPPTNELEGAVNEAKRSVFGNSTALGRGAGKLKHDSTVGNFVIPFSGVPSSIATRIIERSPLGLIKAGNEVVKGVKTGAFDQRAFTGALADAAIGTAGAAVVGKVLADNNLITLGYPSNDQKEIARWQAEGITPYSIKLGNKYISLNYVQPFGSILAYGAAYQQARKDGGSVEQATAQAAGEAAKSVTGQSFLQGVSGALSAVQDPAKGAAKYVESAVSGVVPNLIRAGTKATDPLQRQVNGIGDAVTQGIPGLRQRLLPKVDVTGQNVPRATSPANSFLNPLKPSNIRNTPVSNEVDRLHNTDPTNTKMDVQPTPVNKSISVSGNKVSLTDKQRTDLQRAVGKSTYDTWGKLIQTDGYKNADDATKAKMLNNIQDAAVEDATRSYVVANNLGTYNKPESKKAVALHQGSADITSLATSRGKGGTTTVALTGDKRGSEFLNNYNALSSDRKKSWSAGPLDPKYQDIYNTSSQIKPTGMPDLPKQNTTLKAYADYLKANQTAANELERNKARGDFLKTAYKASLTKSSQDLFGTGYTVASKIDAIKNGDISKNDLENAIGLDNLFVENGLTSKPSISKSVRAEFGYSTPSTGSGRGHSGRRRGSRTGRRVGSRKGIPKTVSMMKTPRINTKAKGFKSVSVKAPSFKSQHKSLPKLAAYKTPKVTKVKVA